MKIMMMAAAAAVLAAPAMAQTPPAPLPLQVEIPELPTAVSDPTCGGRIGLAQQATCVMTTQGAIGGLAADAVFPSGAETGELHILAPVIM